MDRARLKQIVEKTEELPTLPAVATKLLQLTNDERADANAVAYVIESDQSLTAGILQLVNSSTYGFQSEIPTINRAVSAMGWESVRCMALGMAVAHLFPPTNGGGAFPMREFWKHSLACAVCAEMLASKGSESIDKSEAFVAALLHDIGKLVLATSFKQLYDGVVEQARETDKPLLELEEEIFGASHPEVGKWLAERWGLPTVLTDVIWLHHQSPSALKSSSSFSLHIHVAHIADNIVRSLMIGSSGNDQVEPLQKAELDEVGITEADVAEIKGVLCKRVEERAKVIDLDVHETDLYLEALAKANMALCRTSLRTKEQNKRLRRRERRFRALHDLNAKLSPKQSLDDVLVLLGQSLRDGFGVRTGLCFVAGATTHTLRGKVWRNGNPLQTFEISVENGVREELPGAEDLDPTMQAVLAETGLQFRGSTWVGRELKSILRRHNLLVAPMLVEGQSMGQFVIDMRTANNGMASDLTEDELLAFGSAAGMAISRVFVKDKLKGRSEELATAMWKQEQAHKQLLHAERLAAVGKMAAGAAHEINNPLAIISGRAQMMLTKEKDPAGEKALRLIVDQCARASKILTDLMGFARPALPRKQALNINATVIETLGMFESRYASKGIKLVREFSERLPRVHGDNNQLQQVFVNLLINAEHAIKPPGTVTVRTSANKANDKVVLTFADTGCGIPTDKLQQIFEPFYTTKEEGEGTGLGLSLAYGIIKSHEGTIAVKSKVDQGTAFVITLPKADEVETIHEAREQKEDGAKPGQAVKRVLIVDDEVQVRAVICDALTDSGYEVQQAANGVEALEALQHGRFDLITLDIRMPRMDGIAVLLAVRSRRPDLPVIVVTGLASEEEVKTAQELGVFACIRKPFEVSEFLAEVGKALSSD